MSTNDLYQVVAIYNPMTLLDRPDGRCPLFVGSVVSIDFLTLGAPCLFNHRFDTRGNPMNTILMTSPVQRLILTNPYSERIFIETINTGYELNRLHKEVLDGVLH